MSAPPPPRLAYIDWMRGLACLLMFQTHCYDSWLSGEARKSAFFMWSQLGGTFPAPLFLFLAGISFALVTDKFRVRGGEAGAVARTTILRGAEIFGLGLLFRLQEFLLGFPWSPWTDLLRVDILNAIGLSMMLMGVVCRMTWPKGRPDGAERGWGDSERLRSALMAAGVALMIALATPLVWSHPIPHLPWPIQSYLSGVHTFNQPQSWLFPIFPWAGFALAGLAAGFLLMTDGFRRHEAPMFALLGGGGLTLAAIARWADHSSVRLYSDYDFWHTSPNFFLIRVGMLMMILLGAYAWCRWGAATWGFSPLIQLGKTSLLVYWAHIELVYGRFSILPKRAMGVGGASLGLLVIFTAMLLLSLARTHFRGRRTELAGLKMRPSTP